MNPDVALFHFLNDFAGQSPLLDWIVRALVNDYAVPTLMALMLGGLWSAGFAEEERRRIQRGILFALIGLAIANSLMRGLQVFYFRPRPFATETVKLLFYRPSVSSFPSVPVATMFCYVTGIWSADRRAAGVMLALAVAFALARVIAGVHYPSDIIGGAALGVISTWLPMRYVKLLDRPVDAFIRLGLRLNLA
jgi:undecaprenyl-diphosphatase